MNRGSRRREKAGRSRYRGVLRLNILHILVRLSITMALAICFFRSFPMSNISAIWAALANKVHVPNHHVRTVRVLHTREEA